MKDTWQARQIYEDDAIRAIEEAWKDLDAESGEKGVPNMDDLSGRNPGITEEQRLDREIARQATFEVIEELMSPEFHYSFDTINEMFGPKLVSEYYEWKIIKDVNGD